MATIVESKPKVIGFLPNDTPPVGAMLSLGFQQFLTMFPATVLVAVLTKFDVGMTLLASGLGTIVALLVARRKIPMYYGSSFSYIAVIITVMSKFAPACFNDPAQFYCADGVRIVQVGILLTAVFEIAVGLLIMRIGKAALDRVLPPIVTGSMAMVIGVALAGAALGQCRQLGCSGSGLENLGGGLHHPGRNHPVLGLPAGQRAARHAANPVRRDLWLPRCHPVWIGAFRKRDCSTTGLPYPSGLSRHSATRLPGAWP